MLTGKWTPMNRYVQKFNSIYDQTKLLSGENKDDLFARVLIFFKDQTGKEFTHRSAWLFLKINSNEKTPSLRKQEDPEDRPNGYVTGSPFALPCYLSLGLYLDDGTVVGDTLVVGKVLDLITEDGPCCGLFLNVDKTELFWPKEDPRSRLE
nr:hypothetical protein [Tanacetum cinerariifolium]